MAAGASAAGRPGAAGARRLPARQHDPRRDRAEGARGARLGAVDARRSARRFHLSPDAVAHAAGGHRRRHRLAGRLRSRGARHSVAGRLCRAVRRAHRARSAAASAGLSRLQFLPHRRDPAGHRRPGARRHRDQRARRGEGADGAAAGARPRGASPARPGRDENRRAGARRRRRAGAGADPGARGARRDGREAGRHRRRRRSAR